MVDYDASGVVVGLVCHQVKFYKSPNTQVRVQNGSMCVSLTGWFAL